MGIFDKLKKKEKEENTIFIKNAGGCVITKSIYNGESKLKWIFREESKNENDNRLESYRRYRYTRILE